MEANAIAIIPARGGSKRIHKKNIKPFLGKPILEYSIQAALNSGLFKEVMVSTDDNEIAEIAKSSGAAVPFMRSQKNSDDKSNIADVLIEVLDHYDKNFTSEFFYTCCILPSAPLLKIETILSAFDLLKKKNFSSIFPVIEFSYPTQRALVYTDGKIKMEYQENYNKRSQDLSKRYHDSGQFYVLNTSDFLREKSLFMENSGAIILSELEAQDIDTEVDWKMAEMKYRILNKLT